MSFKFLVILIMSLSLTEGPAALCDNNRGGKSKDMDHTCECARAREECKPDDPELKKPMSDCKTYCHPDDCKCENRCTS